MSKQLLILILLVATVSWNAHGQKFQSTKAFMTSQPAAADAVRQINKNNLNLDNTVTIRTPSSAVQDWSLVCQQLCRAALGGTLCAPYKSLPFLPYEVQLKNAADIMESKQYLICPELCKLQLGDDVCTCKNYITNDLDAHPNIEQQQRNVCAIICDHNSVTLTGCTPCRNNKNIFSKSYKMLFHRHAVPRKATKLTTPNWNDVCARLCKTGDGGALCNCNLSPFMI